jgi:hypothetical protein
MPSQPVKAGHGGMCLSSSYIGSVNRRIAVQVSPGIIVRPYFEK